MQAMRRNSDQVLDYCLVFLKTDTQQQSTQPFCLRLRPQAWFCLEKMASARRLLSLLFPNAQRFPVSLLHLSRELQAIQRFHSFIRRCVRILQRLRIASLNTVECLELSITILIEIVVGCCRQLPTLPYHCLLVRRQTELCCLPRAYQL